MEGNQGHEGEAAVRHSNARWLAIRHSGDLGNWKDAAGERRRTFAILTVPPNELVAQIHNRMPAILRTEDYDRWLGDEADPNDVLKPFPAELLRMSPISTRVNKPENDDPSILDPVSETAA
jgi:putative SOS response-associated peptidase YedK